MSLWEENLSEEIKFWEQIIMGTHPYKNWCEEFKRRCGKSEIAHPRLHKYLDRYPRVLDVGSGPASKLGTMHKGKPINLTCVDPLANEYNELLTKAGLFPRIRPIYGTAENIERYVEGKFDFVYSINALDHAVDPLKSIISMLRVCSESGIVRIENVINEGLFEKYSGLHQWNLMPASGDLVIWNKEQHGKLLSKELPSDLRCEINIEDGEDRWMYIELARIEN